MVKFKTAVSGLYLIDEFVLISVEFKRFLRDSKLTSLVITTHKSDSSAHTVKLIIASTTGITNWYVLSCLWDDTYKITLAANQKE